MSAANNPVGECGWRNAAAITSGENRKPVNSEAGNTENERRDITAPVCCMP